MTLKKIIIRVQEKENKVYKAFGVLSYTKFYLNDVFEQNIVTFLHVSIYKDNMKNILKLYFLTLL